PQADPTSGRSERRGIKMSALPADGYDGELPKWPLPRREVFDKETDEDGRQVKVFNKALTARVQKREAELWAWAWSTPQAWAWAQPSEAWRLMTIAMWVRTYVLCESAEATAADKGSLHRFADQIGMTPAGLKENGWAIAVDEVGARRADKTPTEDDAPKTQRRLRSASS
ncbi:MAG: hypothetical protein Q4G40_12745, partial [Brachybacterium sp.]|nr:hypothetical protein [Brachybacterium sp.]